MTRARVVLADDHPALAAASRRLLAPEYDVVAVAETGPAALDAVRAHDPEILILDVSMPGLTGLEVAEHLQGSAWKGRIVMLTLHQDRALAERAFISGAMAYVTKTRMARDLIPAIESARAGERFCSSLPNAPRA